MAAPFQNLYHLRRVAQTQSKPCSICYKATASVLTTPDSKDWFYTCDGHLKDPGFASPVIDKEAEEAKRKKEELEKEIEKVKQEYAEKHKARKDKKKKVDKVEKDSAEKAADAKDDKERDDKIKELENSTEASKSANEPRVFELHRSIYQMRINKLRNAQEAKRMQQRMKDPNSFPSVPTGIP